MAVVPTLRDYNRAIAQKKDRWPQGLHLLRRIDALHLRADVISFNSAITFGSWLVAPLLLDSLSMKLLESDIITYTSMLTAFQKQLQWHLAASLLMQARHHAQQPNVITYNATLSGLGDATEWQRAAVLLDQRRGLPSSGTDVVSFNAVLHGYEKASCWQEALLLLEVAPHPATAVTYGTVISACGAASQWLAAWQLLFSAAAQGLETNLIMYSALITACGTAKHWQRAAALLSEAQRQRMQLDLVAVTAAVSAGAEEWPVALDIFSRFQHIFPGAALRNAAAAAAAASWREALQLASDEVMGRNAVLAMSGWMEALEMLKDLQGARLADMISCNSAMSACRDAWELSVFLLVRVKDMDLRSNVISYNTAVSACQEFSTLKHFSNKFHVRFGGEGDVGNKISNPPESTSDINSNFEG
eukprot:s91_g33.t1